MVPSSAIFAVGLVVLSVLHHGNGLSQLQTDTSRTNTDAATQDVASVRSCRVPGVQYPIEASSGLELRWWRCGSEVCFLKSGIGFDELLPRVKDRSLLLIDVRNTSELINSGKLEGSYNLPFPDVDQAFEMSPAEFERRYGFPRPRPEDTNVVLSCGVGVRAVRAWEKLEPLGYCNMKVYFGSYNDWKQRGGPLVKIAS